MVRPNRNYFISNSLSMAKDRKVRNIPCMNIDPENSKWGYVAPRGGCLELVTNVDETCERALCWRCTQKIANTKHV
jgi:hypothetical protein